MVFSALLLFGLLLLMIQIWLFVTVLEEVMGGNTLLTLPVSLASIAILAISIWMLKGIQLLDRSP